MNGNLRVPSARAAILALVAWLALFGAAAAQEAGAAGAPEASTATVAWFDDLPANGGRVLHESTGADAPAAEDVQDARYVEIAYADRAYLFALAEGAGADGSLDLADGASDGTLTSVSGLIREGVDGSRNLLLTSRREGDVNVVTGIYDLDGLDPAQEVELDADSRLAVLNGGSSVIRTVAEPGGTLGEVTVATHDGIAPLLDASVLAGAPADGEVAAGGAGEEAAPANDAAEAEAAPAGDAAAPADEAAPAGDAAAEGAAGGADAEADAAGADAAGASAQDSAREADIEPLGELAEGANAAAQGDLGYEPGLGAPLER